MKRQQLRLTDQISDFAEFAKATGREFVILVSPDTKIADDIIDLQKKGMVEILPVIDSK